jgi:methyltransferase (TIGR00027 family)
MHENRASLTAAGIAMLRAIESSRPEDERVCYDPFARRLIPGWMYWMGKFFTGTGYAEWRGPGVQGFLAARERYIDDYLQSCLEAGIRQLVLLGAGYDSRAYRFEGLKHGVKVFEVDHPATQGVKIERLKRLLGRLPDQVVFVDIDFNQQSLAQRLRECSYDPALKGLFIWQGVTYYLTPEAVDATLAFIVQKSGPGSAIVFDYIDSSVLQAPGRHGEVRNLRRYRRLTEESLSFGIPEGQIESFLTARGFAQVKNVSHADLHRLYFTGKRQKRTVAPGYGIVAAVRGEKCEVRNKK